VTREWDRHCSLTDIINGRESRLLCPAAIASGASLFPRISQVENGTGILRSKKSFHWRLYAAVSRTDNQSSEEFIYVIFFSSKSLDIEVPTFNLVPQSQRTFPIQKKGLRTDFEGIGRQRLIVL